MSFFSKILNMIFPEKCLSCGKQGSLLCKKCLYSLPRASKVAPETISVFEYRHKAMKDLMWKLKYSHAKRIADILSPILYETLFYEISERQMSENFLNPLLVAIPISKSRKRGRGYNQSEAIIESLLAQDKQKIWNYAKNVLIKVRETPPQARIKVRSERLANLKWALIVNEKMKDEIKGRNVVVVDDITTTGGTLEEARRALRKAGARRILGFTVAH